MAAQAKVGLSVQAHDMQVMAWPDDMPRFICRAKLTALILSRKRRLYYCGPILSISADP